MRKNQKKIQLLLALTGVAIFVLVPMSVQAREGQEQTDDTDHSINSRAQEARQKLDERREEQKQKLTEKKEEKKEAAKTRLEETKLKVCQNRQKSITNIMSRIGDRGQKQLDLFSTITERAEKFYADKGYNVENYEQLVADVAAKKAAAEAALQSLSSMSSTFDCEGDDPRAAIEAYHESRKAKIQALKEYKTAVKNLIVGIKSAKSTDASGAAGIEESQE